MWADIIDRKERKECLKDSIKKARAMVYIIAELFTIRTDFKTDRLI